MKRFDKFTEDMDKAAALKARQRDAVSKFKSSSETPTPQKPESRVHSGDVATQDMIVYSEIITKPKRSRKTRKRKKEKETE